MNNWQIKKLGEICKIVSGNTPKGIENISKTGNYQFYKVSDMNSSGNEVRMTRSNYNLSNEEVVKLKLKLYPKGTVIFPKRGGAILTNKKRVLSKDSTFDLNLMGVLPNENVNSSFLFYWFINLDLGKICDGSNIPQINNKNIAPLDFPIPPIETQQAIVSKIEELFSELDKGIEDLKTAQLQLKTYRQSVLKWAFEGKLTNENVKDGELPKGWEWTTVKDISTLLGDGLHGTPKYDINGEYYFINGNNLNDGKIEIKANTKKVSKEEFEKYKKQLNDKTIFVSINGSLGYTAFYNNEPVILGKSACYFNVKEGIDKHYIRYIFTSQRFTNYSTTVATGSTIKNVSLKSMREFEIPLPPLKEQHLIVQEIESRLSVADKMEESIAQSLQQAEALRQSILKKAFSGELV